MPIRNPSRAAGFDGDAALDAAREAVDGTLYSTVEYDTHDYRALYVDDAALALYEDEAEMEAHFEQIHAHVNLDFMEVSLFADELFPLADRVEATATRMDYLAVVRVYGDQEGLFLAVEPEEPLTPLLDAVVPVVEET